MESDASPSVSVLLPVGTRTPTEAAASVLAQAGVDLELIVLHDGTRRDEAQGLLATDEARVRAFAHPPQGISRSLTLGVHLARGAWVLVLSPHERLRPGALRAALDLAGSPADASAPVGVLGAETAAHASGDPIGALVGDVPPTGGSALLRTDALRHLGGFDPTLRFAFHLDAWLRVLGRGRLVLSERVIVDAPSRRREPGEREAEATRLERMVVLARALSDLPLEAWDPTQAPSDVAAHLGRTVLALGEPELLPYGHEILARAAAAGAAVTTNGVGPAAVRSGPPREPSRVGSSTVPEGEGAWLRVGLEVASLDRGGLENVVADLALGFPSVGIEPYVLCTERGGARANELRSAGIDVTVLRATDREKEIGAWLDDRGIDLLNPHFSFRGTRPAAARGVPVVPTLHNAYAWVGASAIDEFRALDPLVSLYTAVSSYVAGFAAERFSIPRERFAVVANAHRPAPPGTANRSAVRAALGVSDEDEVVVQIGRVEPVKCPLALVDAMELLRETRPRLRAWIVGAGTDLGYLARVEERIANAGLGEVVQLLGQRDDVPDLLAASDVLAMPSVIEGLSLSVLEALGAGVPAVLTRTGDAEMLLGGTTRAGPAGALIDGPVLDPLTVEGEELFRRASADRPPHAPALAQALARVLDDAPAMRERAHRRAEELAMQFAPERIFQDYAAVFGRVVASAARRAGDGERDLARECGERDRVREAAVEGLRAAVAGASRGFESALDLAEERLVALREAQGLAYETQTLSSDLETTAEVSERLLDKLRLTNRLRGALASIRRRVTG